MTRWQDEHDPLCPSARAANWQVWFAVGWCQCKLVLAVRADERKRTAATETRTAMLHSELVDVAARTLFDTTRDELKITPRDMGEACLIALEPPIRADERRKVLAEIVDNVERQHRYAHFWPAARGVTDCGCQIGHVLSILRKAGAQLDGDRP